MNEYITRFRIFVRERLKKILFRRYKISVSNIFNRNRYYIIRRNTPWAGFFSNYLYVAAHIEYALSKGYMIAVDMENYPTYYNEANEYLGTLNAWEYYFEQPHMRSVKEARESKNYILSDISAMMEYLPFKESRSSYFIDRNKASSMCEHIKQFIRIKQYIQDNVENFIKVNFQDKKVLGVHYRGTDKKRPLKYHYLAVGIEDYINKVKECISSHKVDAIFVCTDEKEAIKRFETEFGNKVFYTNSFKAETGDTEGIHIKKKDVRREHHNYLLGYEVLFDMLLLSRCNYFIFSHSNVANAALLINNQQYEQWYLVDDE